MSDAFNCPILFSQQSALSHFVGELDKQGVEVPQDVRNLAGRINYYAEEAKKVTLIEVPPGDTSNKQITWQPKTVAWYQSPRDGRASISISSGGTTVCCGVGNAPGEFPDASTSCAIGGTEYVPVKAGQFVSMKAPSITEPKEGFYLLANP